MLGRTSTVAFAARASFVLMTAGMLGGCGAQTDNAALGPVDENIDQTSAALTMDTFVLRNYQTGFCLGVAGGVPNQGTPFVVWHCDRSANQNFTQHPLPYGEIGLYNGVGVSRFLSTTTTSGGPFDFKNNYSRAILTVGSYESWIPMYAGVDLSGHECYRFKNPNIGGVLGVSAGSTKEGAAVITWTDFNNPYTHPDQLWCVYAPSEIH